MESSTHIRQDYREQWSYYLPLSQEEVVTLYESEGIGPELANGDINLLINLTKHNIEELREKISIKRLHSHFGEESNETIEAQHAINKFKETVTTLEKIKNDLLAFPANFEEGNKDSSDHIFSLIDQMQDEIKKGRKRYEEIKQRHDEETNKKMTAYIEEHEKQIEILEARLEQLQKRIKSHFELIASSTTTRRIKNRPYPSNELRNRIVLGNIGIVRFLARRYYIICEKKVEIQDLISIGYEALLSAAHYYIPSDKGKFITYASKCIKNKLEKELYAQGAMKKRPYKYKDFFKKEIDQINYIQSYLNALYYNTRSGKHTRYSSDISNHLIQYRLTLDVRSHNWEAICVGEPERLWKRPLRSENKEGLDGIISEFLKIMQTNKFKVLISDEERELVSLELSRKALSGPEYNIHHMKQYMNWYLEKLKQIQLYLEIEKKLMLENDGIIPTEQEILDAFNEHLSYINKRKYQIMKNMVDDSCFEKNLTREEYMNLKKKLGEIPAEYRTKYYDLTNHNDEYRVKYGVNFFADSSEDNSRAHEKSEILDGYYNISSTIRQIEYDIKYLEGIEDEKVVLFISEQEGGFFSEDDYELSDYNPNKYRKQDNQPCVISRKEAIEILKAKLNTLPTNGEEYLKQELKRRSQIVKDIVTEINKPLIEANRKIAENREIMSSGRSYQKRFIERDILGIKKDIQLLFVDDDELMSLITNGRGSWKINKGLSTEDEAINNVFLEDYKKALMTLSEKERSVLELYYDENGAHSITLKQIAESLNVSESGASKIKKRAITKLRGNPVLASYNEQRF